MPVSEEHAGNLGMTDPCAHVSIHRRLHSLMATCFRRINTHTVVNGFSQACCTSLQQCNGGLPDRTHAQCTCAHARHAARKDVGKMCGTAGISTRRAEKPPLADPTGHEKTIKETGETTVKKRETYRTEFVQLSRHAKRSHFLHQKRHSPGGLPVHFSHATSSEKHNWQILARLIYIIF